MGSLKDVVRDIMNEPWIPAGKKASRKEESAKAEKTEHGKPFCDPASSLPCITICKPAPGCDCGCDAVRQALIEEVARRKLQVSLGNAKMGCTGTCGDGPFLGFPQKRFFYTSVRPGDIPRIVEETLENGRLLPDLLRVGSGRSYRSDILYEKKSGLLGALDESVCMVEAAKYFLDFEEGLTCAKCTPCRIGLKRLQEALGRVLSGEAAVEELDEIRELCRTMIDAPYCDFAMTSSGPVLSALTHFEDEFRAHVEKLRCLAGACEKHLSVDREARLQQKAEAAEKRRAEEAQRIAKAEKAEAAKKAKPAEPPAELKTEKLAVESPPAAEVKRAAEAQVAEAEAKPETPVAPAVAEARPATEIAVRKVAPAPAIPGEKAVVVISAAADVQPAPEPVTEPEAVAGPPVETAPAVEERRVSEEPEAVKEVGLPASPEAEVLKAPPTEKPAGKAGKKDGKSSAPVAPPTKSSKGKSGGKKKKSGGKGKGPKS